MSDLEEHRRAHFTQAEMQDIEAAFRLLVASGRECEHPAHYRMPLPWHHDERDPNEWECGLCGLWQISNGRMR